MFDWNRRPGLPHTEEEVERSFEEFYEDVHTEFLKFGEIINFKVCRNGSAHLRGNVYVHYKMLDSALLAYRSINGRYFAGKQVICEYVGVTRWKIAICGEYMKTRLTTCSRGTACNFIHCFRNPGGDYEWADWDKPPPKYWVKKMSALFGCMDDSIDEFKARDPNQLSDKNSQRTTMSDANRYHNSRRSRSRDKNSSSHASHRDNYKKIGHERDYTRQKHNHEGIRDSKDTLERDCMDTMTLRNISKELSFARKSSDRQIQDEGLILNEDEVCEAVAEDRDRSNNELHSETSCSRESNRSRHCNKKHNRMKDESTENGGLGLDQVKSSFRTNWDERRNDEEEDRDDGKKRMGRDRAGDGKEKKHGHEKKRRRSGERMRENSDDYADKKKTYSPARIHSDEDGGLATNYPIYIQSEAVDFIDRWDPS